MTWYLGITTTKKIAPYPGWEKERGEMAVKRQLLDLGIEEAHAPVRIEFMRKGKRRFAEPTEEVLLPNYIFADIPAELFYDAIKCRGLVPSLMAIRQADLETYTDRDGQEHIGLLPFMRRAEAKEAEARRIIASNDHAAMCQFDPGDTLEILSGPFMGQLVKFTRMIQSAHDLHPMVGFEGEMFGSSIPGMIDPLSVRRAS